MSDCRCMHPPFSHLDFETIELGEDPADQVNSTEVTLLICKHCGRKWLRYFFEHPLMARSGTWYRGLINEDMAKTVTPENAVLLLESLEWYFRGGSFFNSDGERRSGRIR